MNVWCGVGRTTRDIKVNESGKVGFTTLAVQSNSDKDADGKYKTYFIPLRFIGEKTVTTVSKYISKGTRIGVSGELVVNSSKDDNGGYKTFVEVVVRSWEFAQSKNESNGDTAAPQENTQPAPVGKAPDDSFMDIPDGIENELPFM